MWSSFSEFSIRFVIISLFLSPSFPLSFQHQDKTSTTRQESYRLVILSSNIDCTLLSLNDTPLDTKQWQNGFFIIAYWFFFSLRTILRKSFCLSHFDTQHLKAPLSSANERVLFRETGTKISQEPPHQRAIKRTHRREGVYIHGITHFCLQEQHTYCAELSHLFCLFSFVLYKVLMKKREKFYDDAHVSGVQYFVSMYSHCLRLLFVLHHNFLSFLQTWLPLRTTWPWYYLGSPCLITATPVNIAASFVLFFYENNSLLQSIISLKTCVFVSCVCVYTCVWVCAIHEPSRDLNFCGIILQSVYKK